MTLVEPHAGETLVVTYPVYCPVCEKYLGWLPFAGESDLTRAERLARCPRCSKLGKAVSNWQRLGF